MSHSSQEIHPRTNIFRPSNSGGKESKCMFWVWINKIIPDPLFLLSDFPNKQKCGSNRADENNTKVCKHWPKPRTTSKVPFTKQTADQMLFALFWEQGLLEPVRLWSCSCCVGLVYFCHSQHQRCGCSAIWVQEAKNTDHKHLGWMMTTETVCFLCHHKVVVKLFIQALTLWSWWMEYFEM